MYVCGCVFDWQSSPKQLMSLSPKSQVMFAPAFSWIGDCFIFLTFVLLALFVEYEYACNETSRASSCTAGVAQASGARGALRLVGGRHNNVGVSLRERRDTAQVMLGVSLRARWDATPVWIKNITEWSGLGYMLRQQGRHKTGTTGDNSLHPTQQWTKPDVDESHGGATCSCPYYRCWDHKNYSEQISKKKISTWWRHKSMTIY